VHGDDKTVQVFDKPRRELCSDGIEFSLERVKGLVCLMKLSLISKEFYRQGRIGGLTLMTNSARVLSCNFVWLNSSCDTLDTKDNSSSLYSSLSVELDMVKVVGSC
jgi:hypothetical protein